MKIEQFVMAYRVEQDRLRAMLSEDYVSLRPVLRFNAEIRGDADVYVELNTPVSLGEKRGWFNIARWDMGFTFVREGKAVTFISNFLRLKFVGVGIEGGCPAERNNDGCYYRDGEAYRLVPPETITANKEFCDGEFAFLFSPADAHGESYGDKTLPAVPSEQLHAYPHIEATAENAASIPCEQMLGQYRVTFERGDRL